MTDQGGAKARFAAAIRMLAMACLPAVATAAPQAFDIPAGLAAQTLTRFAQQAAVPLAVPYEITEGRRTRAVRGRLEPEQALRRMLRGTGLAVRRVGDGQFVIELARRAEPVAPAPAAPPAPEGTGPATELDAIHVTGTRIELDGMDSPTPMMALSGEELSLLSPATLAEALVELPHFLNNDTPLTQSFGTSAAAGSSHLNLRGIGSIRTLTLLDGRRVVPATRFGTVDYALLPKALVRRVEVVTGGASAAYGSDAVSGVVNVLLDSDFDGVRLRAQGGLSDRGDNGNGELSLTFGRDLGDHSHLTFSGELYRARGIQGYASRDWFRSWSTITNPDPAGPAEITVPDVRATGYTYGGLITSGPLAGTQFLPGGVPAPFVRGAHYTGVTQSGGDGVDPAADLVWLMPDQTRMNGFMKFSTEVAPGLTAWAQLLAGHSDNAFDKDPPSLWGTWEATIYADNAFLPASLRSQMATLGIGSFRLGRVGADGELGRGRVHAVGNLLSATFGATREWGRWQTDGYYQYGQNRAVLRYTDTLRIDRVYRGIDSVVNPADGRVVCRSTLTFPDDGCVPVNLFGAGSVSPAARAWITEGRYEQSQDVAEHVAELTAQGWLADLPAGKLNVAAGINWRRESVTNSPRRIPADLESIVIPPAEAQGYRGLPAAYIGASNLFERTVVNRVAGHYAVWEAFGEAALPLAAGLPGVELLTLHGALRFAHYSGSGPVLAWKGGIDWRLHDALRLRATRSRDVRAGSLSERFDVNNGGITIVDTLRPGNPAYAVVFSRTGNPDVDPELADTWTAGLVYTPRGPGGLSLTADYYDIRIHDAIAAYGVQNIINLCRDGRQELCGLIERGAASGLIQRVNNPVTNVTEARSRGIDVELSWRQPLQLLGGDESLALRMFANRTLESSVTGISGVKVDRAGQTGQVGGAPRWQANFSLAYWRGPLHVTVQQRLISAGSFNATLGAGDLDDNRVSGAAYTTLRASWDFRRWRGLTAYAHVGNLFDRNPPRAADWGFVGSLPTNESLFDVLGRRFVLGVSWER